jgi:hypothetical protein
MSLSLEEGGMSVSHPPCKSEKERERGRLCTPESIRSRVRALRTVVVLCDGLLMIACTCIAQGDIFQWKTLQHQLCERLGAELERGAAEAKVADEEAKAKSEGEGEGEGATRVEVEPLSAEPVPAPVASARLSELDIADEEAKSARDAALDAEVASLIKPEPESKDADADADAEAKTDVEVEGKEDDSDEESKL